MKRTIIPHVINRQKLCLISENLSVHDAVVSMSKGNCSALIIVNQEESPVGIITERDIVRKIIIQKHDIHTTTVKEIMTENPKSILPEQTVQDALNIMQKMKIRHLPVVQNNRAIGLVSIQDLYSAVNSTLSEELKETEDYFLKNL